MRDERLRLEDIAAAIDGIQQTVGGANLEQFSASWTMQRAVERGLEVISEAGRGLSDQSRLAKPAVPWEQIAGIGNVLRHEYHRVEAAIIWNITVVHLPVLARVVAELLGPSDG